MRSTAATNPHPRQGLAGAYSAAGEAWRAGPTLIYDALAREQLAVAGVPLAGATVLDLGAGTGAASRAALAAGAASVIAVDVAAGMLTVDQHRRPPGVVGDALSLPFAGGSFDVVVASFSLNHVDEPAAALRESARVTREHGWVLSSTYAADDTHPVKQAVERVATRWGWRPAAWHDWLRTDTMPRLASADLAGAAAIEAGLVDVSVASRRVAFPDLGARELVAWRLGMAQLAEFVGTLDPAARRAFEDEAVGELGAGAPVLERSVLYLAGRVVRRVAARRGSPPPDA